MGSAVPHAYSTQLLLCRRSLDAQTSMHPITLLSNKVWGSYGHPHSANAYALEVGLHVATRVLVTSVYQTLLSNHASMSWRILYEYGILLVGSPVTPSRPTQVHQANQLVCFVTFLTVGFDL